jgi:periplasmic protein TonB
MDGSLIYRKTRRGAAELAVTHGGHVATPSRRVLIVLDGRRTVEELIELFGAETVEHALAELEAQGLARLIDPEGGNQTTQVDVLTSYAQLPSIEPELAPINAKPGRRGLVWIALALPALAIGGGYWVVVNGNRPADAPRGAAVAAARPADPASAPAAPAAPAPDPVEPGEPSANAQSEGPRELPLSGLPPVVVTKASATVAEAPPVRRAPERAPVTPAEPAPAPAPAPEAAPKTVAAADPPPKPETPPSRPREAPATAPTAPSPAPVLAPTVEAPQAERVALRVPLAEPLAASAAPPAPPPVQVASVAPTPLPATEAITLHPRKQDPPEFPGRAVRARIDEGRVLARIWVTADGKVDQVDILKATPPRIFDDEVRRALSAWTFDPPGQAVNKTVELTFKP